MNWKVLLGGLAVVGALTALLASGFGKDPKAIPSVLEGRAAAPFQLPKMAGGTLSLEELKGSPVVLNFWTTTCQPCVQEHPVLLEGARRYQPRGVVFLGVVFADDPERVEAYLDRHGRGYTHLLDTENTTAVDYGVTGVPETFFLDREGRIQRKHMGPLNAEGLQAYVEELL